MNRDNLIKEGERLDDLMRAGLHIIQNPKRFCFGMDAVLLAGFAKGSKEDRLMDFGTGNGILPLLMYGRYQIQDMVGIDIQEENIDLARRSIWYNGLEDYITVEVRDIREALFNYEKSSFDIVITNPPYIGKGRGLVNTTSAKAIARHETTCTLEDIIEVASQLLKVGGRFFMVHKPFRLDEMIKYMSQYKLPIKRLQFVHPYLHKEPNMVLVEGIKGSKSSLVVEPPIIVYQEPGVYTKEIYERYGY